jgi:TRAP-type mannitol/chloroaromatic compound transport system permease small subunit
MTEFIQEFIKTLGDYLPTALAAVGILIGGWLIALIVAAIVRGALRRTKLDQRIANMITGTEDIEAGGVEVTRWISRVIYYLIMLFVIVAFLQALNLTVVAEPINELLNTVLSYIPMLLGAGALLLVAWVIASALKFVVIRVLKTSKLDERLSSQADIEAPDRAAISDTLGNVVYWLVFLLFLPAVLDALSLQGLLVPVQGMVNEILGVLPNILGAFLILVVGWVGARIVRQIVANLLVGFGADRLGEQTGLSTALGGRKVSDVIGTIVYVLILIPILISALNTLQIDAVSRPASEMLTTLLNALPAIFGALLLIGVAYFVARIVGSFITNVLTGIGFDKVLSWIGLGGVVAEGQRTPSQIVGYLTTVAIMLFAVVESANLLGFTILAQLVSSFLVSAGGVLLGLFIFGLGLYLAGLADRVVRDTAGPQAHLLAPISRVAIVVFAGALALRETGIADDIVNLAFGIVLGTIAISAALAFGLGSRDIAARELDGWLKKIRTSKD